MHPVNDLRNRSGGSDEDAAIRPTVITSRIAWTFGRAHRQSFAFCLRCRSMFCRTTLRRRIALTPDSRTAAQGRGDASSDPLAEHRFARVVANWIASENGDTQPIERELARRGFGKLSKPLVRQFFSENPQDRMRLVDNVLAQPGGGSEAWLLLLAGDADPDVRLFAVTFMATSNNAALVEKAWQAAIRDHDPRVADLAGRLRERREGPLRR